MWTTIIILVVSAIFFMQGKVRSDLVAVCAMLALLLCQILTPAEALAGFSSTVVIMMVGLFVVGGAIFQTGLAKMISGKMLQLAGNNEVALFLLVMLVTSFIGAFVSNTGTVALMLPIVVSMAASSGANQRRLLMPLAFASSMGGMMTLIGTPPNLIIQDTLTQNGYDGLSFFSFLPVGLVCLTVGILVLLPLTKWFLLEKPTDEMSTSRNKSLKELASEYKLSENLFLIEVNDDSDVLGKSIAELDVRRKYSLNIMEVRRAASQQGKLLPEVTQLSSSDTVLQDGDTLYVTGERENVRKMAEELKLDFIGESDDTRAGGRNSLAFYNVGIAEIVILPSSSIINYSLKEADFRSKYNVNVLAIRRNKDYLRSGLANESLHGGDVLLVQGDWSDIAKLSKEEEDWVVLGQPLAEAAKVTLDYKAPIAAIIMILMILMMVFGSDYVAPVTAVIIAAVLMIVTGCIRSVEAAYKTINWQTIVLFAAMMPMSTALEKTGVSSYISDTLVSGLGAHGPIVLLAGIYFSTSIMTMFISNTVTALLMAPIALQSAVMLGVSPVPFLFAVTVAASMCFASPFSTPPNALVMPAGQYSFMDYVKVGLPLQIIMGIVMIVVLPLLFPF